MWIRGRADRVRAHVSSGLVTKQKKRRQSHEHAREHKQSDVAKKKETSGSLELVFQTFSHPGIPITFLSRPQQQHLVIFIVIKIGF